jgi:hypothetical protein
VAKLTQARDVIIDGLQALSVICALLLVDKVNNLAN